MGRAGGSFDASLVVEVEGGWNEDGIIRGWLVYS